METALYYTFSTIAQTLAAAIALLAAFLLYRLQIIAQAIDEQVNKLVGLFGGQERLDLDELHAQGKHEDFLAYSRDHHTSAVDEHVRIPHLRLEALLTSQHSIFQTFYVSLWLTVGLVAASVAVLMYTPAIGGNAPWATVVFVLGGIWFLACLLSYAALVGKALAGA